MKELRHELTLLILSRYPLVILDSAEEAVTENLVRRVAADLGMPLARWTSSDGLSVGQGRRPDTRDPDRALAELLSQRNPVLAVFHDLDPYLERPEIRRRLRDAETALAETKGTLILTGSGVDVPRELQHRMARIEIPLPGPEQLEKLVRETAREMADRRVEVDLPSEAVPRIARALAGLERLEARRILLSAGLRDGRLDLSDLPEIFEGKRRRVEQAGALSWVDPGGGLDDLGGARAFKRWIERRREAFSERAKRFGLDPPKGLLLAGVPGTGKSLACKSVAGEWGLPLLRLDVASLYDKYIGETEANLRRALSVASAMAPSVLWIDEIEKAVQTGGGSSDDGLSKRLLGTLLTWMQERPAPVFVLATANDVEALPVELVRRGRFDETFFFDLPEEPERRKIFSIHIAARERDPSTFDLAVLARETAGFSGSEIEGVVVAGLYHAFAEKTPLSTDVLLHEAQVTRPLSEVRPDAVARLREWGRRHAVAA